MSELKAWIIDEAEIYAAPTCLDAVRAYKDETGEGSCEAEIVSDDMMDIEYPLYDDDENVIEGETTSIRKLLNEATETCWLATTVI